MLEGGGGSVLCTLKKKLFLPFESCPPTLINLMTTTRPDIDVYNVNNPTPCSCTRCTPNSVIVAYKFNNITILLRGT